MPKKVVELVQSDADTLWWSKEPKLGGEKKRFRRFVAKATAIGPRSKGGLGNVDWALHVDSFMSQWVTRYIAPGDAGWKHLWDTFLLRDVEGRSKFSYPGRGILFARLDNKDRKRLLKGVPQGAKYLRDCVTKHLKLALEQDKTVFESVAAEPIWHNHRFMLTNVSKKKCMWYAERLDLRRMSDLLDKGTSKLRTLTQWRRYVQQKGFTESWGGHQASLVQGQAGFASTSLGSLKLAHCLLELVRQIPVLVRDRLQQAFEQRPLETGSYKVMLRDKRSDRLVKCVDDNGTLFQLLSVDGVGKFVQSDHAGPVGEFSLAEVAWWEPKKGDLRIAGALTKRFPAAQGWLLDGKEVRLDRLSIKTRTEALSLRKMKPPAAEKAWSSRLGRTDLPWSQIWKIRSFYASPRDQFTWLRVMHRNLYVAGTRTDIPDTSCRACDEKETILHLVTCPVIQHEFWEPLLKLMDEMGFPTPDPSEVHAFLVLGVYTADGENRVVKPEHSGMLFIAWRCLYAAVVGSRVDDKPLDLEYAYYRTLQMTITRVTAYGEKWKLWSIKNKFTSLKCIIPLDKRDRVVIEQDMFGDFQISSTLRGEFDKIRSARASSA